MSQIINLGMAKEHLQVGATGENTKIQDCIDAAEMSIENWCGLYMRVPAVAVVEYFDGGSDRFYLRYRPVAAITTLENVDAGTVEIATTYRLYGDTGIVRSYLGGEYTESPRRWKITYTAGYALVTAVPLDIRQLILGLTKMYFENREDFSTERLGDYSYAIGSEALPTGVRLLLERYRRREV